MRSHFVIFEYIIARLMLISLLATSPQALADVTQLSGGMDARSLSQSPLWGAGEEGTNLHGSFLNIRHVISDDKGDRYVLVAQLDANDNLSELEPYQFYIQRKGSLGGTNLQFGRYILPFGLLAYLDTERQLLQTNESIALGIKLDTGIQLSGFINDLNYAFSISQGVNKSDGSAKDMDNNKLLVARIGLQQEESRWGLSYLNGRIDTDNDEFYQQGNIDRQRLTMDAEIDLLPWMLRLQLDSGKDDKQSVSGALILADYDFNAHWALNSKASVWNDTDKFTEYAIGFSYRLPKDFVLRASQSWQKLNNVNEQILSIQLYWDFSYAL